jgi:hypothetical protein
MVSDNLRASCNKMSWEMAVKPPRSNFVGSRHNQCMKRTREAPVNGPKCARTSLAHFGPGGKPLRAVYVGR